MLKSGACVASTFVERISSRGVKRSLSTSGISGAGLPGSDLPINLGKELAWLGASNLDPARRTLTRRLRHFLQGPVRLRGLRVSLALPTFAVRRAISSCCVPLSRALAAFSASLRKATLHSESLCTGTPRFWEPPLRTKCLGLLKHAVSSLLPRLDTVLGMGSPYIRNGLRPVPDADMLHWPPLGVNPTGEFSSMSLHYPRDGTPPSLRLLGVYTHKAERIAAFREVACGTG